MRETYQPPAASPAGPPHDRTPEETPPPTVYRIRHNATESDEPQRKLARARARGNRPPYAGGDTEPACPPARAASRPLSAARRRGICLPARARSVPSRHSREGGNPFSLHGLPKPQRVERIPWSCRPLSVMPIDRTDPARIYRHRATETARSRNPTGSHMRGRNTRARRRLTERSGWDMVAAALCEGSAKSAERPKAASSSYRLVVESFGALPT